MPSIDTASLSSIAHDLRQPLHAVLLYLDALERRIEREDAKVILKKARDAAQAMADQLSALSLHNRLIKNDVHPYWETSSLAEIGAAALAGTPGDGVTLALTDGDFTIETDAGLLVQALRALIDNAVRQGGARLEIARDGDAVLFHIRDGGPGIASEERAQVFTPFVKGAAGGEGLGLGLSNAAGIAAALGGRLDLDEDQTNGGAFSLRCPARASAR